MGLRVQGEDGKEVTPIMGSYGIGIERILTCAIELLQRQRRHEPAGFDCAVLGRDHAGQLRRRRCCARPPICFTRQCTEAGIDALLDDRDERPGVKFKDADLIGIPYRITVGKKLSEGKVEFVERRSRASAEIPVGDVMAHLRAKNRGSEMSDRDWAEIRAEFPSLQGRTFLNTRHLWPIAAPRRKKPRLRILNGATKQRRSISSNGLTISTKCAP